MGNVFLKSVEEGRLLSSLGRTNIGKHNEQTLALASHGINDLTLLSLILKLTIYVEYLSA